jgi:hypothetical protein
MELFPKDNLGRSYGSVFVLAFVLVFSFTFMFRPWAWICFKDKIVLSAGTIAMLERTSIWVCAYLGFLGDPFSQMFEWGVAFFKNRSVISGFNNASTHLLSDYGALSIGLGFMVKGVVGLATFIFDTVKIPLPWMVFFKTAVLGLGTCLKIFEVLMDINGFFELLPNIEIYKKRISTYIHEFVNSYYEWWGWQRVLRVETGRSDEEPIRVKSLEKGENEGHKIVLGGSRLDGMRLFGIHLRDYTSVLASATFRFSAWFLMAYGSGKILCF